jgi:tRNA (cmo5U34)-methyltransferase
MALTLSEKSTVGEIRERFDQDVERFSRLETGQQATIDAPLVLDLIGAAAKSHLRPGDRILDLGCGAGNLTLKLLQEAGPMECHLADLSQPMLDRALQRVTDAGCISVETHQSDLRDLSFSGGTFDCIVAGAVLHHLRDDADWEKTFAALHHWLKPGGRLYVSDLVTFDEAPVQEVMWRRYGEYLESLGGADYRDKVFDYIEKEDSPRSLPFQIALLQKSGFTTYDILHRNSVFACYYASR